jgi:hypothetical protein
MTPNEKTEHLFSYTAMIGDILIDFQFVEESLRMFISNSYQYIAKQLSKKIPFEYDYRDVEKDALGTLINKFEKLNDNKPLISELRDLTKYRNDYAHRGFLTTYEEMNNSQHLESELETARDIKKRTQQCLFALLKEWKKIQELLKS